ncbi:MAG: 2-dehydropantoate 2-reductase [Anaerolineales bacterium]|nr:2-dehydropantoate 2-reductase [Anaerolineales bacterium]
MAADTSSRERRLLMGCGSVGGVLASALLRAGRELTIVTNNNEITDAVNAFGLQVRVPKGQWNVPAQVSTLLGDIRGPFDAVLLAMKATDVEQAARDIASYLSPEGYVVTLQNGVVEDRIAGILGQERVIGALVGWGATMRAPGEYEMTSRGEIVIGELDGRITARAQRLLSTLESATATTLSNNIYGVLWSKLAINCTITTLGAVTGQLLGRMLSRRRVRRLALAITSEVVDVARAQGISMEPVGGTLDIGRLYLPPMRRDRGFGWDILLRQIIMFAVGVRFRRLRSSMLQSLERGRRSEIEFMNGYVVEKGREVGVPTPVNTALTSMVREIESGERSMSPKNLEQLVR